MSYKRIYIKEVLRKILEAPGIPIMERDISLSYRNVLVTAVYHNFPEAVSQLLDCVEFDKELLKDIGLEDARNPYPIYLITQCYKVIFSGNFIDSVMPWIVEQRKNTVRMLDIWKAKLGIDADRPVNYHKYKSSFYSDEDDADYEDVFCFDKLQDFLDNGCKKIDVDLYMAVNKFQYDKVRELILQGANPDANLVPVGGDESDPYNCRSRVGDESAYLSCEVLPLLTDKYHGWVINYPVNATQVENVIGYAAHEVMWDVMMKSNNKSGAGGRHLLDEQQSAHLKDSLQTMITNNNNNPLKL